MMNTHSRKAKYILAGLVGAAAGGLIVALTTLAIPKMRDMCKRMMASVDKPLST